MKSQALGWFRWRWSSNVSKAIASTAAVVFALAVVVLLVRPQGLAFLGLGKWGESQEESSAPEPPSGMVTLSERHAKEASLVIGQVTRQTLQATHTVPGKVVYHASRQVELQSPAACVVRQVLVETGSQVRKGDKLAILSSAAVGLSRDEVAQREAELTIAQQEADWRLQIDENLQALLVELKKQPEMKTIESQFADQVLGDYRDKVFSAYSKLVLANLAIGGTQSLSGGVLSGRVAQERRSTQEVQAAQFQTVCETSKFESRRERERAQAAAQQAGRLLEISRQELQALLGPFADDAPRTSDQSLNEFAMRSPLAGRVEERFAVQTARISAGQPLFSLANTEVLWISAEIHERNWSALAVKEGRDLAVQFPALPDREFTARVRFVGAKVSPETRSVPLVAEIENSQGLLKPGMFAWVAVPVDEPREALAVRPAAVAMHDEQAFVFVPEDAQTYRRVNVTTGLVNSDWIEITAGLVEGQKVVERGAALLKAEFLLPTIEE